MVKRRFLASKSYDIHVHESTCTTVKVVGGILGWACRGLTDGSLLLWNFSVAFSVSPDVSFIFVLIDDF